MYAMPAEFLNSQPRPAYMAWVEDNIADVDLNQIHFRRTVHDFDPCMQALGPNSGRVCR